jgi:hypothetical protein
MSALSTPTHEQLEQRKKKRKQKAHPIDQKPEKSQTESFEMSKTWSLKTWATTRCNQVKHS